MKKIILLLFPMLIIIVALGWKENITITGNVKDESGRPVRATVKAGKATTVADANGNYKITVSEKDEYLLFTAIGYTSYKSKINHQKVINVIMKPGATGLTDSSKQDVVVTAMGIRQTGNASQNLSGKVPSCSLRR
jgi:hypothetical protein